jgi:hypothetical protein
MVPWNRDDATNEFPLRSAVRLQLCTVQLATDNTSSSVGSAGPNALAKK